MTRQAKRTARAKSTIGCAALSFLPYVRYNLFFSVPNQYPLYIHATGIVMYHVYDPGVVQQHKSFERERKGDDVITF